MSLAGITNALPLQTVEGLIPRGVPSCAVTCSGSLPSATDLCSMVAADPPQLGNYGDCLSNVCSADDIDSLVTDATVSCMNIAHEDMANSASSCAGVPSSITVIRSSPTTTESPSVLPSISSSSVGLFQNATASSVLSPTAGGNATLSAVTTSATAALSGGGGGGGSSSLPAATHETTAGESGTASKTESPSSIPTTGAATALALPSIRNLAIGLAVGAIGVFLL